MSTEQSQTKGRVLVVDDEVAIRDLFREVLTSSGWSVDVASNGDEALEMFDKNDYDLVTLDSHMPGRSGQEVHRTLSDVYGYGKRIAPRLLPQRLPPILVVTGWFEEESIQRMALGERIVGVLRKPVSCEQLIETTDDIWAWEVQRRTGRTCMLTRLNERITGVS